jgi:FkbM family methyltransferase
MLIPDVFQKWNIHPKGLIHIGAHECEERSIYLNAGLNDSQIIWIEGNPNLYNYIKDNFTSTINIYQGLISDKEEPVEFIITNNSQSSSFLDLKLHKIEHPEVYEIERITVNTTTLPKLYEKNNIDETKYDFLAMDIQGAELLALKGMTSILHNFKWIYLEVNTKEIYESCGLLPEIIEFLSTYNFKINDINITVHGWGDALFIKE